MIPGHGTPSAPAPTSTSALATLGVGTAGTVGTDGMSVGASIHGTTGTTVGSTLTLGVGTIGAGTIHGVGTTGAGIVGDGTAGARPDIMDSTAGVGTTVAGTIGDGIMAAGITVAGMIITMAMVHIMVPEEMALFAPPAGHRSEDQAARHRPAAM